MGHLENIEIAERLDIPPGFMSGTTLDGDKKLGMVLDEKLPIHVLRAEVEHPQDGEETVIPYPFGPNGIWTTKDLTSPEAGILVAALYDQDGQIAAGVAAARRFRRQNDSRELGQG